MNEHPNALRIRALFDAFARRDVAAVEEALAEDAVWHFPGRRGRLAGSHRGREAIFAFLLGVEELTAGTFSLELEDVVAGDRFAVAMFRGSAAREGRKLDNPTCLKIRVENGRAVEIHEFVWDLFEVDEFWS